MTYNVKSRQLIIHNGNTQTKIFFETEKELYDFLIEMLKETSAINY